MLGGSIWADSQEGSSFYFTIPNKRAIRIAAMSEFSIGEFLAAVILLYVAKLGNTEIKNHDTKVPVFFYG